MLAAYLQRVMSIVDDLCIDTVLVLALPRKCLFGTFTSFFGSISDAHNQLEPNEVSV